jgi:hypothetical protein
MCIDGNYLRCGSACSTGDRCESAKEKSRLVTVDRRCPQLGAGVYKDENIEDDRNMFISCIVCVCVCTNLPFALHFLLLPQDLVVG